ncbi:MAG: hydroxyacylglutathione hydrolase [Anderseniella sp.]|nr:hydroxyacylglutathione hydrolase [Anderseniella sp.]
MSNLQFHLFPCLSDNYGVLVHCPDSGATASIDAPEAAAVEKALGETGWTLTHILITHHHHDHVGGVAELKRKWNCEVIGNADEPHGLPGLTGTVTPGGTYDFAGHQARIIATPGHTLGHITWHFADDRVAFAGDTLFTLGCGRVFEGTMEQMWSSMQKLAALPPETVVYCGHEYTLSNGRFALSVEPDNAALKARMKEIEALRAAGKPTVPTTVAQELETNPFLRAGSAERFAEVRKAKDNF